jgi:hypothetical protein
MRTVVSVAADEDLARLDLECDVGMNRRREFPFGTFHNDFSVLLRDGNAFDNRNRFTTYS